MDPPSPTSAPGEATFCFVDLEGFTALTEKHGDEDAARLALRFADLTRTSLGPGDRLIKTLGDAVLVAAADASAGISFVERLLARAFKERRFPSLRAGLHHGPAVHRQGDVFGAAVNLAARVAAEAYGGEVLGTAGVADAARQAGIPVVELGPVRLKNVRGAIELFSIALMVGATGTAIDPVCRTPIDRRAAVGHLAHRHVEYWFCSLTCAAAFASNPAWHVNEDGEVCER